jgi:hypothetical protein
MTDSDGKMHGGPPRVRREKNGEPEPEIIIDTEELLNSAVDAGTAALVSVVVSRSVE